MKYSDPKINIAKFDSLIKTEGEIPTMAPVSANYTKATHSLTERFESAAENIKEILVFKW